MTNPHGKDSFNIDYSEKIRYKSEGFSNSDNEMFVLEKRESKRSDPSILLRNNKSTFLFFINILSKNDINK